MAKKLLAIAALLVSLSLNGISAQTDLIPNLIPLPADDLSLQTVGAQTLLRFSTTSWNSGIGPLELRGKGVVNNRENVYQRVYRDDGTFYDRFAGSFVWHSGHGHFHVNNYALYTLKKVGAPGGSQRIGNKTTFCIIDTDRINRKLPGAPKKGAYRVCGKRQGMSVGYGDTYGYWLLGQSIDVTGLEDGQYTLTITIDPKDWLLETNEGDNESVVGLKLIDGTVCKIATKGKRCR